MADTPLSFWIGFNVFVLLMLALDLGVFHRKAHEVKVREALTWSAVWIALALVFCGFVWWWHGSAPALQFLTGYLLEKALSVDNLFVFLLIFGYFKIPSALQHRVLFWGILGALIMRAIFIFAGIALINQFQWLIYILGAFLVFTGFKLAFFKDDDPDLSKNPVLKLGRRYLRILPELHGSRFFVRDSKGLLWATPLVLVLLLVETTDVVFALDSIPAILAITRDPFIVYTSNIFAILGLRALYFALSGVMELFHHLNYALAFVLVFVGLKMIVAQGFGFHLPIWISLGVIAAALTTAVVTSLMHPQVKTSDPEPTR